MCIYSSIYTHEKDYKQNKIIKAFIKLLQTPTALS